GILAPASLLLVSQLLPGDFLTFGWRIPFLASLLLVAVGLYVRLGVLETPLFTRLLEERRIERVPVLTVLSRHPGDVALAALAAVAMQAPVYLFTSFALFYGTARLHVSQDVVLFGILVGSGVSVALCPIAGRLSDRLGACGGPSPTAVCVIGAAVVSLVALARPPDRSRRDHNVECDDRPGLAPVGVARTVR